MPKTELTENEAKKVAGGRERSALIKESVNGQRRDQSSFNAQKRDPSVVNAQRRDQSSFNNKKTDKSVF